MFASKTEAILQKKKSRLNKITSELVNPVQTAYLIGQDSNKSEYWLFYCEPNRIYAKYTTINPDGEETWLYYDKQEELDKLLESLNTKGIREKNLYENLQNLVKNKLLELDSSPPEVIEIDDEAYEVKEMNGDVKDSQDEHMQIEEKTTPSTLSASKNIKESMDFWHAKVMEYEMMQRDDNTSRATRWRQKQHKKDANEDSYTNYHNFSLEKIKDRIKKTEKCMSEYLDKWGSRWARPSVREEIMTMLDYADKPPELSNVLLRLNEEWQKCESIRKKHKHAIVVYDEEEESQENENESSNSLRNGKSNEDNASQDKDGEEFYFDSNEKKGAKKADAKKPKNHLDFEELDESIYKIKKINLRLWSLSIDKLKRCWIAVTTNADNLSAIYLSMIIFCDIVTKYCEKKTKQYFGGGKKPKQLSATVAMPKVEAKPELPISLDEIDKFRFTRSQARELMDGDTNKPKSKGRKQESTDSEEEEKIEFKHNKSQNEKTRSKQEKMDELIAIQESGVRRSGRNFNRRKMIIDDDDYEEEKEQQEAEAEDEDDEEEEEEREPEDPDNVKCQQCGIKYRLEDLGLETKPRGSWQCFDCVEKAATQRKTRSTRRYF